jgi:hypothetical protein
MMLSVELSKNPKLFQDIERQLTKDYSSDLVRLAEKLTSVNPRERPTAAETQKIIKRIQTRKKRLPGEMSPDVKLKEWELLTPEIQSMALRYLDVTDIYQVMLSSRYLYELCEKDWWKYFCITTKIGEEIMQSTNHMVRERRDSSNTRERRDSSHST